MINTVNCRATGKLRFEDETLAREALTEVQRKRMQLGEPTIERGVHFCQQCCGWHLTGAHGMKSKLVIPKAFKLTTRIGAIWPKKQLKKISFLSPTKS
jgi:hypothetical protein